MAKGVFDTIRPIEKRTLSFDVIQQIRERINRGELKPNQQLPTEKELTELFQVGRSTIREALTALISMGLVRREKEGLFVVENPIHALKTQVNSLQLSKFVTFGEVFELRKIFEASIMPIVAERATEEDFREIENCLKKHRDLALCEADLDVETIEKFFPLDIEFHMLMVKASHNSVAYDLFNNIKGMLFYTHEMYALFWDITDQTVKDTVCQAVKDHWKLFEVLKSRDGAKMEAAINTHLDSIYKSLKKSLSD